MDWRTFNQRIILLLLLGTLVIGLIAAGLQPYVALAIAGGIVMLLRDAWLPSSNSDAKDKHATNAPPKAAGEASAAGEQQSHKEQSTASASDVETATDRATDGEPTMADATDAAPSVGNETDAHEQQHHQSSESEPPVDVAETEGKAA
ncbi:hypothetical protein [Streptomyces sp. PAN_FS17]|uniref:hypothetical protein n=1 Tax=Streptomyces sp. PAN_FS17 TaxID=1855351 RepID=UPI0008977227|nr:hypothetical protein [Streptomyces sp. PAN_FS17]SEC64245.1 hypothetical protein SAMN05216482_4066 [Streptomyces sp. PAN_FS17]